MLPRTGGAYSRTWRTPRDHLPTLVRRTKGLFPLVRTLSPNTSAELTDLRERGIVVRRDAEREEAGGAVAELRQQEILQRYQVSLDIFWVKDESLEDSEDLSPGRNGA